MRLRLRQLTSFNGYALDATNSVHTIRVEYEGLEAVSRMVVTPFGTQIDLDGNYAAPVKRMPIRAYMMVDATNPSTADALIYNLSQLCGLSAPLKGKAHGGTIVTCTARFINLSGSLEPPWYTSTRTWQKFVMVFAQKTDWT